MSGNLQDVVFDDESVTAGHAEAAPGLNVSADRDELLDRVAVALHDAECPDRKCSGPALGAYYRQADIALGAARPAIAAQAAAAERERIRQLAIEKRASYYAATPSSKPGVTFTGLFSDFADLLGPDAP